MKKSPTVISPDFGNPSKIVYKDPMVWSSPVPKKTSNSNVASRLNSRRNQWQKEKSKNQKYSKKKKTEKKKNKKKQRDGGKAKNKKKKGDKKKDENDEEETKEDENAPKKFDGGPLLQGLVDIVERDVIDKNYNVSWEDIAGLERAKKTLQEAAVLPLWIPNYFQGIREPWKGVLMFGPPGTGKTMLAKAVASMCNSTFFNVSLAACTSKWRGESEKLIRLLFEMARFYAPSTIFFDEIDALASKRGGSHEHETSRRVKTELLVQMDGIHTDQPEKNKLNKKEEEKDEEKKDEKKGEDEEEKEKKEPEFKPKPVVLVLGATNYPWDLDEALRRRLEKRIYIPLPDIKGRNQLFGIFCKDLNLDKDVKIDKLAGMSDGYSASDIKIICRDASMMSLRRALLENPFNKDLIQKKQEEIRNTAITFKDFKDAFDKISPSVNQEFLEKYEKWMEEFGSE